MSIVSKKPIAICLLAGLAMPATANLAAQEMQPEATEANITVQGQVPADLSGYPEGPEIEVHLRS